MSKLAEAVQSTVPFNSLDVSLSGVVRYPDSRSTEFTVELKSKNVTFQPTNDGKSTVILTVAAASLNGDRTILAPKTENVTLVAANPDPTQLSQVLSRFQLTIRVPRKTQIVRVVMENQDGGEWARLISTAKQPTPHRQGKRQLHRYIDVRQIPCLRLRRRRSTRF